LDIDIDNLIRVQKEFPKKYLQDSDEKISIIGQHWFELRTSFAVPRSPQRACTLEASSPECNAPMVRVKIEHPK
jgi:hypothetical protein